MAYVDLTHKKRKRSAGTGRKIVGLLGIVLGILVLVYFFPIISLFKHFIQSPSVLSFIRNPGQELNSTDGRTNFLLLGIDKRATIPYSYTLGNGEVKKNGFLSDTIIIASIDFTKKDVRMLSIPRDLWVKIPGWDNAKSQYAKVNSAYSIGQSFDYPGGGEALAKETIAQNIGVPIHYVVRTDFEGFVKAVDTVGGIDVDVETAFEDYEYPREGYENAADFSSRYKHVVFKKGNQHMSGQTALEFVRSRHGTNNEGSDFARAKRQQKAILGLRQKVLSVGTLADPGKISGLIDTFSDNVFYDIPLSGFSKMYDLAKTIDPTTVQSAVLESDTEDPVVVHPPEEDYGGAWVLIPKNNDWKLVETFAKQFLGILPPPTPTASTSARTTRTVTTPRNP